MEYLAVASLPDGAQWVYEIKLDSYRGMRQIQDLGFFWRNFWENNQQCLFEPLRRLKRCCLFEQFTVAEHD